MGEISAAILCLIFLGFIFCAIIMKYDKEEKELKREEEREAEREAWEKEREARTQELAKQMQEAENRKMAAIQEESEILSCVPHILVPLDKYNFLTKNLIGDMPEVKLSNVTAKSNKLNMCDFVVIDIETTGIALNKSKIVELSAVRFQDFEPIEVFTTLINPQKLIPLDATDVNGITDDMVREAPLLREVSNEFLEFIGNSTIVGHNIIFDLRHLFYNGIDLSKNKKYCTYTLAKKAVSKNDVYDYKLTTLCEYFHIPVIQSHRSEYDCLATGRLFKRLVDDIVD